jgi:hypothetical protein
VAHLFCDEVTVTRRTAHVIARLVPSTAPPHPQRTRVDLAAGDHRAMSDAVAAMVGSCERYAAAYVEAHREPIGANLVLGAILLEVLRGVAALAGAMEDRDLRDDIAEVISAHALDLEE